MNQNNDAVINIAEIIKECTYCYTIDSQDKLGNYVDDKGERWDRDIILECDLPLMGFDINYNVDKAELLYRLPDPPQDSYSTSLIDCCAIGIVNFSKGNLIDNTKINENTLFRHTM